MINAIITVGLGYGDEGKGGSTDWLCRQHDAKLVVRYSGGPQCGHRVELPDGRSHVFSQFGAGTLAGASTYLDRNVIIDPPAMKREAEHLVTLGCVADISVHPSCLVTTHFHRQVNMVKELERGFHNHGSCGRGVGATREYWLKYGNDAIFAKDLMVNSTLLDKLELMRQRFELECGRIKLSDSAYDVFQSLTSFAPSSAIYPELRDGTIVFEGAQGVLLDEWYGFHPHTTWSKTTDQHAWEFIQRTGIGVATVYGITRLMPTRHGKGPFRTEVEGREIEDKCNLPNHWQGQLRHGYPDIAMLRYAANCLHHIDGIMVTCVDQLND
jgi:adenylosuccinate synthase